MPKINNTVQYFKDFLISIRRNGVFNSLKIIISTLSDRHTDKSLGISTQESFNPANSPESLRNKAFSSLYEPTRAKPFIKLMQQLNLDTTQTFIDVGCGKGRAMILAANCGFTKVKGIEFSKELVELAQKNCELYKNTVNEQWDYEVHHCDILDYSLMQDDRLFYLYDPFKKEILKSFLTHVKDSLGVEKTEVTIIYHNNLTDYKDEFYSIFDKLTHREFVVNGNSTTVYTASF